MAKGAPSIGTCDDPQVAQYPCRDACARGHEGGSQEERFDTSLAEKHHEPVPASKGQRHSAQADEGGAATDSEQFGDPQFETNEEEKQYQAEFGENRKCRFQRDRAASDDPSASTNAGFGCPAKLRVCGPIITPATNSPITGGCRKRAAATSPAMVAV
jgi:hypothetical protein